MDFPRSGNEEVDRYMAQAAEQLKQLSGLQEKMSELRGEAFAADDRIRVEVGPSGNLLALEIDPRAMRLGSEALAEQILEASKAATVQMSEKLAELTAPFAGGGQNLARAVTGDLPEDLTNNVPRSMGDLRDIGKSADPLAEALRILQGRPPK